MDWVIADGQVIDGTGSPPYRADLGITGDRIEAIGDLRSVEAPRISAAGRIVSPGFIDIHSHSDFVLLANANAESAVRQGVTTLVVGNCGYSCAPAVRPDQAEHAIFGYRPDLGVTITWTSFADYLDTLEQAHLSVNVAALVGHAALRIGALGLVARPARPPELKDMVTALERALDEGAAGLSTGLEYLPGRSADRDELLALCRITASRGRVHATHVRDRNHAFAAAVDEALALTRETGVSVQISHLQPRSWVHGEAFDHIISALDAARRTQRVDADLYPYTWGMVAAAACVPPDVLAGGPGQVLRALQDGTARSRMRVHSDYPYYELMIRDPTSILIAQSYANPDLVNQSLLAIAEARHTDPFDTLYDLLREEGGHLQSLVLRTKSNSDDGLMRTATLPYCMFASDGITLAHYGPLQQIRAQASSYGYAPRSLQLFVRETGALALSGAIRRMTSMPAEKLGIIDRGVLRPRAYADVVVFDADTITDNTTVTESNRYPSGIDWVMVNGVLVYGRGDHTDRHPGAVLRSFFGSAGGKAVLRSNAGPLARTTLR